MRLASRIQKLERRALPEGPTICPTCELPIGSDDIPPERITLCFPGGQEPGGPGEEEDPSKDFCPECGRRVVFRIEFDSAG